jgi:hypothetical protein
VIASADDSIRYVISKPLPSKHLDDEQREEAESRCERQLEYVKRLDNADSALAWYNEDEYKKRMKLRMSFAASHRRIEL